MQVNGKYLKDEQNEIISPIVSTDTVYLNDVKLSQLLDLERTETIVGTYEEEGYLYAQNIVCNITAGNQVIYKVSDNKIDIKFFVGKFNTSIGYQYILPYYESATKFCRVEVNTDYRSLRFTTGTDSNIGNGSITGRVFYTLGN